MQNVQRWQVELGQNRLSIEAMTKSLIDWLMSHVLEEDRQLGIFMAAKLPPEELREFTTVDTLIEHINAKRHQNLRLDYPVGMG